MEMYRRTFAEINLDNLVHNFQLIKRELPESSFTCPMVKANAYGHGDIEVGRTLAEIGAQALGVCLIEEGLLCRRNGIDCEILVFRGFDKEGAKVIIENNLTAVVSTEQQLDFLETIATKPISIHVKFDTGMNRLGFPTAQVEAIKERLQKSKMLKVTGVLTHLFHGEDAFMENGSSANQIRDFQLIADVMADFEPQFHCLNSAGIVSKIKIKQQKNEGHFLAKTNWGVRPGLMVYGYNPLHSECPLDLRPVMTLKSFASQFRRIKRLESVSYSATWKAQRDSVIAIVPIGYADGYHRLLSNKAMALFLDSWVPVVGSVTMDYLMLDVTDVVQGRDLEGLRDREVVLFGTSEQGQFLSAEKLAQHASTITWEILTSVGERVPRVFRKGGE